MAKKLQISNFPDPILTQTKRINKEQQDVQSKFYAMHD